MSNVRQFYSKEDIQEQACMWISRIDRGLSETEKQALVQWCQLNTAHHNTLLEMATYWDNLTVLNELSGLFPLEEKPTSERKFANLLMAACVLFVSILSVNTLLDRSFIPMLPSYKELQLTQTQSFGTQIGEQASFALSDGSHIQLNTNTQVIVNYSPEHRQLLLVQGEAQFDVAKDIDRPFTVTAGEQSFTALGTIFNVQKDNEQAMELVVTEGKVLITKANEVLSVLKKSVSQQQNVSTSGLLVQSGEKATIAQDEQQAVEPVSLSELQRDLAWQQGMLIFEGESLTTVLADISRYTDSRFEIIDPQISQLKVAGYFKANDIDGLLASLKVNLNIDATRSTNNTILLSQLN